jgi:hypothetical protein
MSTVTEQTYAVPHIPPYSPSSMKLSHSNDSIVTAVEEVNMPHFALGTGYELSETHLNQPHIPDLAQYLDRLFKKQYSKLLAQGGGRRLKIVGLVGSKDEGCQSYVRVLGKVCREMGVHLQIYELEERGEEEDDFEATKYLIGDINGEKGVDGMIVFTPIFGGERVSLYQLFSQSTRLRSGDLRESSS